MGIKAIPIWVIRHQISASIGFTEMPIKKPPNPHINTDIQKNPQSRCSLVFPITNIRKAITPLEMAISAPESENKVISICFDYNNQELKLKTKKMREYHPRILSYSHILKLRLELPRTPGCASCVAKEFLQKLLIDSNWFSVFLPQCTCGA